jgi:Sulfotransferase domain
MGLRVVGAGLGRTGTLSLKQALERLLGGPCYHMLEVFAHPDHVAVWHAAARGEAVDWSSVLDGYVATVDWPAASFWPELLATAPGAIVLLSTRSSPSAWWRSADDTIFQVLRQGPPPGAGDMAEWFAMWQAIATTRFTPDVADRGAAVAAYRRHNAAVRASVPADRLVEWQPGDGWGPLCSALGLPEPDEPFPHVNTTGEFRARAGFS